MSVNAIFHIAIYYHHHNDHNVFKAMMAPYTVRSAHGHVHLMSLLKQGKELVVAPS